MQQNFKEISRYLRALYRYRYLFVFVSFLVMTGIAAYSFSLPKMYKADSTVFIEKNVIDNLVEGIAVTPSIEDRIRVLQYALLSRDLIVKTLEEIDSDIFLKPKAAQQRYISDLTKRTEINVRKGDLFIVSIVDKSPEFAQRYINTLVEKYVEENISAKRAETYGANRFLEEQLQIFKQKLEKAEDAIIAFRKDQGIFFSIDEKGTLQEIRDLNSQLDNIKLTQDTLLARKQSLQKQLSTLKPTVDIVSKTGESRLSVMENQLNTLLLKYTENYPEVIRLRAEIASLKQHLNQIQGGNSSSESTMTTSVNPLHQEIQRQIFDIDAELSSLDAKKKNLQEGIVKREKILRDVPAANKELGLLVQERDSYKKIYNDLLARMGQSEVSKQMEIGDKAATFRIVDPAVFPENPVSPDMLKMLLIAIAAGFGCGFGVVFLLENLDDRVRNPDFFSELGVELLAVIPKIENPQESRRQTRRDILLVGGACTYFFAFVGVFAYLQLI